MILTKRLPRIYLVIFGAAVVICLPWLGIRLMKTNSAHFTDPVSREIESRFKLRDNFEIHLVAREPEIQNPMTMCVDKHGAIYVTESSTYRYGIEGAPSKDLLNPIKRIQPGSEGKPPQVTIVAQGFANPVMGIDIYEDKVYATCLNELFVMDIGPGGQLTNRRLLVKDSAEPWNPFGMYRVVVGPDARLWLAIADHPDSKPVTLTGSDGSKAHLRGQSGGFVRCNLDGSKLEVVVQGFRAPFAFDIDPWGHLWAVSNGEGSPNIYVDVLPGMDYGYHSRNVSYAWLAGKTTLAPPVNEMGPGANTVALHYYGSMFPDDFWGNIIMANWGSHGNNPTNRSLKEFFHQKDEKKKYSGIVAEEFQESPELFLSSTDSMFRPVGMVNAPDGGLYLADWHGHDDESNNMGRIFKISYIGNSKLKDENKLTTEKIRRMNPADLCQLLGDHNRFNRDEAQRTLVQSGPEVLESIREVLKNGNAFAAANAIWTLTRIHSVAANQSLTLSLKHPDPRVRALGLRQLRQASGQQIGGLRDPATSISGNEFNPSKILSAEVLATLAAPLTRDSDEEVRIEAALALNSSEAISRGLLNALEIVTDKRLRYQIGFELGRYGDFATLGKLHTSSDPQLHLVAMIAAQNARNENTAVAVMVKDWNLITDENASEKLVTQIRRGKVYPTKAGDRLIALEWLEAHQPALSKPLSEFLLSCVRDNDYLVKTAALRTLRQSALHSDDIKSAVISILGKTKGQSLSNIQLEALYTLGSFADIGSPQQWLPWLKDTSKNVITAALRALREQKRDPAFMNDLLPAAVSVAENNSLLAEEVWYTFRQTGIPDAQLQKLPGRPFRSADKNQFAKSILSGLKNASAQRGQWSFNITCATCHSVRSGAGEMFIGPNLANIGAASQPQYLIESVLEPSKVLKTGFQMETVETTDGKIYSGQMETKDQEIIIKRTGATPVKVPMANVKRRTTSHISPMPEGLYNEMTVRELADLTAFLLTLKGDN